jgi:uncharacterized protein with beta-barrel porin domain
MIRRPYPFGNPAAMGGGVTPTPTLYYLDQGSGLWDDSANWFEDQAGTIPHGAVPTGSDDCEINEGYTVNEVPSSGYNSVTNNGTVTTNAGTVTTNDGIITTNNGYVTTNTSGGTVSNNNQRVTTNNGTVNYNESTGEVTNNYGVVVVNNGTVFSNAIGGTINDNYGSVTSNCGTVVNDYGYVGPC